MRGDEAMLLYNHPWWLFGLGLLIGACWWMLLTWGPELVWRARRIFQTPEPLPFDAERFKAEALILAQRDQRERSLRIISSQGQPKAHK